MGQRILDVGSGVGDVTMLMARVVGPSGEVVGIERDQRSIDRARARMVEAGFRNVRFQRSDVSEVVDEKDFDAVVGRFILMFLPDPVAVLRSLSKLARPGGVLAFQEVSWAPFLALTAHLPLWSACLSVILQAFKGCGANSEMGPALYRIFQEAGLPAPSMQLEVPLGDDAEFTRMPHDLLLSLKPQIGRQRIALEPLGDFDTLPSRLQTEVVERKAFVTWMGVMGAWARKPNDSGHA
ncbi:MAG: class I SAM-dependent methyltransferase [Acidobacteria bacterium]|nr:class I SAM-dependent methyltransferase [Acidobacteriota bacterium]